MSRSYQLGAFAVLTLIALRLALGWHFYSQGAEKLREPDEFTSKWLLRDAKGPLAEHFHSMAPTFHRWDELLAFANENRPLTPKEEEAIRNWEEGQGRAEDEAQQAGKEHVRPVPPHAPYHEWAEQMLSDWRDDFDRFTLENKLTEEQKKQAGETFKTYRGQLLAYLRDESQDIREYQHELHRLDTMRSQSSANEVPFLKQRVTAKQAEVNATAQEWIGTAEDLEREYHRELLGLLDDQQTASLASLSEPARYQTLDRVVPYWDVVVGVALLIGLFSRVAAFGAVLLLLGVVSSQPPWLAGVDEKIPILTVELFAAFVLMAIPTGRWAGLDYFVHAVFSKCCSSEP